MARIKWYYVGRVLTLAVCCIVVHQALKVFNTKVDKHPFQAHMVFDIEGLLQKLENPQYTRNYDWIRQRVLTMWEDYVHAGKKFEKKLHQRRLFLPKRQIFLYLGLLSSRTGFSFGETALQGGPLSELVQWSNLITSLYILGHDITIASETYHITRDAIGIDKLQDKHTIYTCSTTRKCNHILIFTDIVGWKTIQTTISGYSKLKCLVRILDSFGTDPAFNYQPYAMSHGLTTDWSSLNFTSQQFYTMFPSSPDNSFLGFAVHNPLSNEDNASSIMKEKKNIAVIWGKNINYFSGKDKYLATFSKFMELHATVFEEPPIQAEFDLMTSKYNNVSTYTLPPFVHNHGVLSASELISLLKQSKFFIGLSEPNEGTAPLEAIALGNVYFNPKYIPPQDRDNADFYRGKPTQRKVTSQQPYTEMFMGRPNVQNTVIKNPAHLHRAIKQALNDIGSGKVKPYLPFEFTYEGFLERISYFINKQDFCTNNTEPWIPRHAITVVGGKQGESCQDACWKKNLICEPSQFHQINDKSQLETVIGVQCKFLIRKEDIYYPAYYSNAKICILQKQPMLFSCVGARSTLSRICPCRSYIPQQTAICENCFS